MMESKKGVSGNMIIIVISIILMVLVGMLIIMVMLRFGGNDSKGKTGGLGTGGSRGSMDYVALLAVPFFIRHRNNIINYERHATFCHYNNGCFY